MRSSARMRNRRLVTLVGVLYTATFTLSCFSERQDDITDPNPIPADCNVPASAQGPGKAVVATRGYRFLPDTLRVAPGTLVTWVNCDNLAGANDPHTATSDSNLWNGALPLNGTFARTFSSAGTFPYHCIPHPSMRAVVIVQ